MAENIAHISDNTVTRTRPQGRDSQGRQVEEVLPVRESVRMMDTDGNEVWVPIHNHRVRNPESFSKYGRQRLEAAVKGGYIPKYECPLSEKYHHLVGGPLAAPQGNEKPCHDLKPAAQLRDEDLNGAWHGCKHYIRVRDARREEAQATAQQRERMTPTKATHRLAEEMLNFHKQAIGKKRSALDGGE